MQLGDLVNATITGDLSKVGECCGECWVGQVHYAYYMLLYTMLSFSLSLHGIQPTKIEYESL